MSIHVVHINIQNYSAVDYLAARNTRQALNSLDTAARGVSAGVNGHHQFFTDGYNFDEEGS